MLTIQATGKYLYVYHDTTWSEQHWYICNGYNPPTLTLERDRQVYLYARGSIKPHYPVPAIPWVDTSSLNYWVNGVCSD